MTSTTAERVKSISSRSHTKILFKQFRIDPDEKAMLAKLSAVLGIDESEALRRMIRATYEAVVIQQHETP